MTLTLIGDATRPYPNFFGLTFRESRYTGNRKLATFNKET